MHGASLMLVVLVRRAGAFAVRPGAGPRRLGALWAAAVPELIVFDLDDCVWSPEMFTLEAMPSDPVRGDLGGRGEGVVGVRSGAETIRVFPGALRALQEAWDGAVPSRLAVASSADTPFAAAIARDALQILEVVPGVTIQTVLDRGWPDGFDGHRLIGRTPPLSSDKSRTHFPLLREHTGVAYDAMLFFDDSNWSDHVGIVERNCPGVVGAAHAARPPVRRVPRRPPEVRRRQREKRGLLTDERAEDRDRPVGRERHLRRRQERPVVRPRREEPLDAVLEPLPGVREVRVAASREPARSRRRVAPRRRGAAVAREAERVARRARRRVVRREQLAEAARVRRDERRRVDDVAVDHRPEVRLAAVALHLVGADRSRLPGRRRRHGLRAQARIRVVIGDHGHLNTVAKAAPALPSAVVKTRAGAAGIFDP